MVDRGDTCIISGLCCDTKVPKLVKCNIALVCDSCDIAFTRFGTLLHRPRPMRYRVCTCILFQLLCLRYDFQIIVRGRMDVGMW